MHNFAFKIAYDGSSFFGWQKTALGPSIEQELESTLRQILQEPLVLQAASRTDRGVHAEGQWVNILIDKAIDIEKLKRAANALLPPSIRILSIYETATHFHPTLHAELKEYHYQICQTEVQLPSRRFFSWHLPRRLNSAAMQEAVCHFLGEHDFSSFCNFRKNLSYKDKIRSIESLELLFPHQGTLLISVKGKSFLYKMVRNIVGTLVYVGLNKIATHKLPSIIADRKRQGAGVTAPAHGLTLKKIYYPQEFNLEL